MPEIVPLTSTNNCTYYPGRPTTYIAVHYCATAKSDDATVKAATVMFNTKGQGSSADFILGDSLICQKNPDIRNYYCWAVGGSKYNTPGGSLYKKATNKNTISIEVCNRNLLGSVYKPGTKEWQWANNGNWVFTEAEIQNLAWLVKKLMKEYNIPVERVIRHYDVNGKPCPGVLGWGTDGGDDKEWRRFKAMLVETTATPAPSKPVEEEVEMPVLKKGINDKYHVKVLQSLLIMNGCSCGSAGADGDFGSMTHNAVVQYQKKVFPNEQKEWDGIAGKKTWNKLLGV